MFAFETLEVYTKSKSFNQRLRQQLNQLKLDSYMLDQLNRASFSIILNIAEGCGRFTPRDQAHFFVIARGSAFECAAILDFIKDSNKIDEGYFKVYYQDLEEISKMLFALIRSNRSKNNDRNFPSNS